MGNFIDFYLSGGFFNHLTTIGFGVAVSALLFYRAGGGAKWLDTCARALLVCVGLGVLGATLGIIEVGAAIRTVAVEQAASAAAAGQGIAVIPLAWALLGAVPLWILCSVARHREAGGS